MPNRKTARRVLAAGVALIGIAATGAAGISVVRAAQTYHVSITGNTPGGGYSPGKQTVAPGDTVVWNNQDATAPHNAACTDPSCPEQFGGPAYRSGGTQSFSFRYSGQYVYHCAVHPQMTGTVEVTGNVQPPPPTAGSTSSASSTAPAGGSPPAATPAAQGAAARPAGSTSASSSTSSSAATDTGGAVAALPAIQLPPPSVRVVTDPATASGTSTWVVAVAGLAAGIALAACLGAWLLPSPFRRRPPTQEP